MFIINFNFDVHKIKLFFYKKKFLQLANLVYKKLKLTRDISLDCSFVNKQTIQTINKNYRHKDSVTDVISFALWDQGYKSDLLGEIYICYDKIIEQKKLYHHSFKREACFLFLHGLLHLLGYDHIKKTDEVVMFKLQDEILNELGIMR